MGWFSQADIFAMDIYSNDPSTTARRLEMGHPSVPSIYAGVAGIRLIKSIGLDAIEELVSELT